MTKPSPRTPDRVQTGVRMDKRMVKVLKALTELHDLSLGQLLEDLVRGAFTGRQPFSDTAQAQIAELMAIYGLDPAALDTSSAAEAS